MNTLVRGDSAFFNRELFAACEEHGAYFAVVMSRLKNVVKLAEELPETAWKPFQTRAQRERQERRKEKTAKRRRRRWERRRRSARQRGKRDLKLKRQWVAEVPYTPSRSNTPGRLIIRKRLIEESDQLSLVDKVEYRFCFTNLPPVYNSESVIDRTYERCDQENIIEQLQNGIAGMRMPTGTLLANDAFMKCARLAFNFKSWLVQLSKLPDETMRWEWKRFRYNYVIIPATVTRHARRTRVRLHSAHPSVMHFGRVYQALLR
jgi:hypothetical protein